MDVLLYCSTGFLRGLWIQVDGEDRLTQIITLIISCSDTGFTHENSKTESKDDMLKMLLRLHNSL